MIENQISKNERMFAALSYVWVLCLIPVFFGKKRPFVEFHARQGLVLLILWLVVSLLSWVPIVGQLAVLVLLIVSIIGVVKTMKGEEWEIPVLGKYARQIKI
jgi:fumarate reductase subunit D